MSGAPQSGAGGSPDKRFGEAKALAQGGIHFRRAGEIKKGSRRAEARWETNVQNPTYITTVWGYGYKWGF